jgi:tryprostatin B 6-hydroxylase
VLTFAFYFLAKYPHLRSQLRHAIEPFWRKSPQPGFQHSDLNKVKYLDAIIHETKRLYNPTCDNAPRITPSEGLLIGDKHIPGNVVIHAPIWAYHRSKISKFAPPSM